MITYRNASTDQVVFRDDSGKRWIEPGETFVLVGDQHAPMVEAIPGAKVAPVPEPVPADATVAELQAAADDLGIPVPSKARKADLRASVVAITGEAPGVPEGEPV